MKKWNKHLNIKKLLKKWRTSNEKPNTIRNKPTFSKFSFEDKMNFIESLYFNLNYFFNIQQLETKLFIFRYFESYLSNIQTLLIYNSSVFELQTRFGGRCDGNWLNLLLLIHNSLKWRNDEISSGNCVNWFADKSRNWSWVSLLIWFEMCVIWFQLRFKCVRFERQYNSDGMKESLLSINERCLSFVIIHTSDGIVWLLRLSNTNTSSLIQFFVFNGNLLILFHSIWTFSNLSNVPILLEYYWENHTKTNEECVIEWIIQFVLEVMWFHSLKVRDVEVMWVERFVLKVFQIDLFNPISTLEVKEVDTQLRSVCHFVSLYNWVRDEEEMLTLSLRMEVDSV
jgi:hypothetical protein